MTLGERVITSWRLGWSGLRVIINDKTLLGFPAVTVAAVLAILSLVYMVIGPNLNLLVIAAVTDATAPSNAAFYYSLLLIWYFMLAFVAVTMHVALVGAIDISMNQRDSKFRDGIAVAMQFIPSIIIWTLINYSFGFILGILDLERRCSRVIRKLFGAAWSVFTFIVIPTMVVEKTNIFTAFSRSNKLMEQTWGKNLHPKFGLGYFFLLLNLPLIAYCIYAYMSSAEPSVLRDLLTAMYFILTLVMVQASRSVLMVAFYEYAATGKVPERFDEEFLKTAFITWDATAPTIVVVAAPEVATPATSEMVSPEVIAVVTPAAPAVVTPIATAVVAPEVVSVEPTLSEPTTEKKETD